MIDYTDVQGSGFWTNSYRAYLTALGLSRTLKENPDVLVIGSGIHDIPLLCPKEPYFLFAARDSMDLTILDNALPIIEDLQQRKRLVEYKPEGPSLKGWEWYLSATGQSAGIARTLDDDIIFEQGCDEDEIQRDLRKGIIQVADVPKGFREQVHLIHADIKKWSSSQTFDYISIYQVLRYLERPERMIRTCIDMLNPGGTLYLDDAYTKGYRGAHLLSEAMVI